LQEAHSMEDLSLAHHIRFVLFHYRSKTNFLRHFFRNFIHPKKHFDIHIYTQDLARIFFSYFPLRIFGVLFGLFHCTH